MHLMWRCALLLALLAPAPVLAQSEPAEVTQRPETQRPETQRPETQRSGRQAPETQAPETQAPETQGPEIERPETQRPEAEGPETEGPETASPDGDGSGDVTTPASLAYSAVDNATVRVFAVRGVGTARVESASGVDRLIAVPRAGHGSGVLIGDRGVVLTARHVIEDAELLAVWVPGEDRAYPARLIHAAEDLDYAFLAIGGSSDVRGSLPVPEANPTLRVRQPVHAIGYPLDARRTAPQSSRGIVSGVLPTGYLQLDMALNPGNSGGPLIDENENLLGIVVARGDPNRGVQGIGVAVPLAPIRAAYRGSVLEGAELTRARSGFGDEEHDREIAELVTLLAQVGATEMIQEVIAVVEEQRRGDILPRLRSLADQSEDPEVMALTAAYFWDVAAVILERAGGHMRPSAMPPGPPQTLARELLDRAIVLCRRAAQADPTLAARSPFVAHVVHYMAGVQVGGEAAPVGSPMAVAPVGVGATAASQDGLPPGVSRRERAPRWFALRLGVGMPTQPAPGFGIDGVVGAVGAVIRPWIGRLGPFAFAPQLVFDTAFGSWGGRFVADIQLQLGAQFRLGEEKLGFLAEAAWAPSGVVSQRSGFSEAGWAAAAGLHYDQVAFLLSWRGTNVPGFYSIHVFQLLFEVTP